MPDEWIATEWTRKAEYDRYESNRIIITRTNSPFYTGERYAVRRGGSCLSLSGEFGHEPMPSSRHQDFYDNYRFGSFEDAVAAVRKLEE